MRDILKKMAAAGATIGGLEYIKYRFNGGKPLLSNMIDMKNRIRIFINKLEGKQPIKLEANDFKIV